MGILGVSLLTTYLLIMLGIVAVMVPIFYVWGRAIREQCRTYEAAAASLGLNYADVGNRWRGMQPSMTGHLHGIRVTSAFTNEANSPTPGYDGPRSFNTLFARPVGIPFDFDMTASTAASRALAFAGRQPIRFDDDSFNSRVRAVSPNEQGFREHMTEPRRRAARQLIEQYPACRITRKEIRLEVGVGMKQRDLEHVLRLMATTAKTLSGESGTDSFADG